MPVTSLWYDAIDVRRDVFDGFMTLDGGRCAAVPVGAEKKLPIYDILTHWVNWLWAARLYYAFQLTAHIRRVQCMCRARARGARTLHALCCCPRPPAADLALAAGART